MIILFNKLLIIESILSDIRDDYNHDAPEVVNVNKINPPVSMVREEILNNPSPNTQISQRGEKNIFMGQKASETYNANKYNREARESLRANTI